METGAERAYGQEIGEKCLVENEASGDNVKDGVLTGSVEERDTEEEVFEEASDSQEQLQELGAKFESEVSVKSIGGSSLVSVVDKDSTAETFEEAIGSHVDDGISSDLVMVVGEEKVDDLVGEETSDKIDEGGTPSEDGNVDQNAGKDVAEGLVLGGGSAVWKARDQVPLQLEGESSGVILMESNDKEELKVDNSEYQENGDLIGAFVEPQEVKDDRHNDNLAVMDTKLQDAENGQFTGHKTAYDSGNEAHNDELLSKDRAAEDGEVQCDCNSGVNDTSVAAQSELEGEPCDLKPVSAVVEAFVSEVSNSPSENSVTEEIHADATNLAVEENDKEIIAYASTLVLEERSKDIHVGTTDLVVEEKSKDIHVRATNLVEEEMNKEIQVDGTNLEPVEKGKEIHTDASNLVADYIKSALSHSDEIVNGVEKNSVTTEQFGNKVEKDSRDSEVHPTPDLASSSGRSASSTNLPARPAGLGRVAPLLEPVPRAVQPPRVNGTVSHVQSQQVDNTNGETEEYDETREKLQMIRVKFLRLAHRLGQTPHNVVVAQVLYRLGLAEQLWGRNGSRVGAFSFDRASAMAEQLEAAGQEPIDFSCTIMVLGKTGVGKSATINSIFDEVKFSTDAFHLGTTKVQDVVGTVQGIKVQVIDTPGLFPSGSDQRQNAKILHSVKRFIKKTPPDIVLYLDRLDMQSRDFGDMPLLRTITDIFGPSIWFNAIVVLTHAASAPPDGPNGTASSYDMFVTQRSHVVQQAIRQAAGDMRLMNPVSLVENHSACRTNRAGQRVLPNGQVWKPHLLLLSFASKILAEANALLKLQDSPAGKPFATRSRALPLPFLLSSLLQSRPQVKLPEEQFGDDDDGVDDDLDEASDSEDESGYDDLPPFRSLTKAQLGKLTKAQKKAYFEELELRERLFMKKQLREEKRRRKMMKKMAAAAKDMPTEFSDNVEEESSGPASVPVSMPDLALPASFDSDNPTHRYRYLDSSNQWLVRPVLETHGWDHDVGYEGINVERLFVVKEKIPLSFSGQVTKDKKDSNVQMELSSSIKHGEGKATSLGFDMQTMGKDLVYTLRSETRFSSYRKNKATAGLSATLMGDALSAGVKVEDKLIVNKWFQMVISGGAMTGRGDVAYGGSLEAQLRDKDYPLGRSMSTLGLSVMDWHGDLAVGCNIQSQIPVGRSTNLIARANLNNRGAGQISVRLNSSEQLQIALLGLVPLLQKLFSFPREMQYGQ
ncbi:hypothetical protein K2173_010431 [Erythroxylum novogranatense]|uniref:AIG1-type G domain-containing protein n=1 Tax=Erythroxylum novogranatense TaxID=1862640 RepID=A0AAV8TDL9_9ROSI|nr:hypothetical protein K2173_010431 [Erythroxylum novogranatense]